MLDDFNAAQSLFGNAMPAADQTASAGNIPATQLTNDTAKQAPRTDEKLQEGLFPSAENDAPLVEVPPEVREIRGSQERRMFSAQETLRDAISEADFIPDSADPKQVRQAVREVREMAADLDLGQKEISVIKDRIKFVKESKPDAIGQREAAVAALNQEFGQSAAQALRDARSLLQRDPRTGRIIEALGLGDDPEVVLVLARTARSQRTAGKLK